MLAGEDGGDGAGDEGEPVRDESERECRGYGGLAVYTVGYEASS